MNYLRHRSQTVSPRQAPPRRGHARQQQQRRDEQTVRRHVVGAGSELHHAGWLWGQAAAFLRLGVRTLRAWRQGCQCPSGSLVPLGRPAQAAAREQRNAVLHWLDHWGPGVGLPTLQALFPDLARAVLADLLVRYRRVWRRQHRRPLHVLHWSQPGRVWAIDFHGPRPAVEGCDPYLLAVRDLASQQQLAWLPVSDATAATVQAALTSLFAGHGAPLVLKSDNGSAFGAAEVQALCRQFGVENLFSPPRQPWYNGSIEAGIGSLTRRTEQAAARRGHPEAWTYDDVALAQWEANATSRPHGRNGPTPDALWAARTPVTATERAAFRQAVAAQQGDGENPPANHRTEREERRSHRAAIGRALVEHGYLHYTRRRIYPPIRKLKVA